MTPLVLLHGFLGTPGAWDDVRRRLDGDRPVEAMALPGHGPAPWLPGRTDSSVLESSARELGGGRLASTFEDVVDAVAARLPPRADLVGYSLGARLALSVAVRHPELVASLVLVGVQPGLRTEAERQARRDSDEALARELDGGDLARFVERWEKLPLFASQRTLPQVVQARRRAERMMHQPAALAWSMRTLGLGAMPPRWDALASLDIPVHLVTGALDEKFTQIAREMVDRTPSCRHTVVGGVGHDVGLESPRALAGLLSAAAKVHAA